MAKVLSLQFKNEMGKTTSIAINNPIVPADPAKVAAVMDHIIAKDIFITGGGMLVEKKGAQLVDREVTVIHLPDMK